MPNLQLVDDKLFGCAGGELEYVSQRIAWRQRPGEPMGEAIHTSPRWYPVMLIR